MRILEPNWRRRTIKKENIWSRKIFGLRRKRKMETEKEKIFGPWRRRRTEKEKEKIFGPRRRRTEKEKEKIFGPRRRRRTKKEKEKIFGPWRKRKTEMEKEKIFGPRRRRRTEKEKEEKICRRRKKSHTDGIVKIGPEFWTYLVSFDRCLPGDWRPYENGWKAGFLHREVLRDKTPAQKHNIKVRVSNKSCVSCLPFTNFSFVFSPVSCCLSLFWLQNWNLFKTAKHVTLTPGSPIHPQLPRESCWETCQPLNNIIVMIWLSSPFLWSWL